MVRMATATEATYSLSGFVHNTMRVREYGCPMQYCTHILKEHLNVNGHLGLLCKNLNIHKFGV